MTDATAEKSRVDGEKSICDRGCNLKEVEKTRLMYLAAELFRSNGEITKWSEACRIVSKQFAEESGRKFHEHTIRRIYETARIPIHSRKPHKPKGRKAKYDDELKEKLIIALADPTIPSEMKTLRKIRKVIPDLAHASTAIVLKLFREVGKDKLVPKEPTKVKTPAQTRRGSRPKDKNKQSDQQQEHQRQQQTFAMSHELVADSQNGMPVNSFPTTHYPLQMIDNL